MRVPQTSSFIEPSSKLVRSDFKRFRSLFKALGDPETLSIEFDSFAKRNRIVVDGCSNPSHLFSKIIQYFHKMLRLFRRPKMQKLITLQSKMQESHLCLSQGKRKCRNYIKHLRIGKNAEQVFLTLSGWPKC